MLVEDGRKASQALRVFTPLPQRLRSVRFSGTSPLRDRRVRDAIEAAERALAGTGRLLIRESGTEPVVRVMAEGEVQAQVDALVASLCATITDVQAAAEAAAPA